MRGFIVDIFLRISSGLNWASELAKNCAFEIWRRRKRSDGVATLRESRDGKLNIVHRHENIRGDR